jgi:hypothetical protein
MLKVLAPVLAWCARPRWMVQYVCGKFSGVTSPRPHSRGLHSLTSELYLRTFGNTSLTLELNLRTFERHPRVNLIYG